MKKTYTEADHETMHNNNNNNHNYKPAQKL